MLWSNWINLFAFQVLYHIISLQCQNSQSTLDISLGDLLPWTITAVFVLLLDILVVGLPQEPWISEYLFFLFLRSSVLETCSLESRLDFLCGSSNWEHLKWKYKYDQSSCIKARKTQEIVTIKSNYPRCSLPSTTLTPSCQNLNVLIL